jgi:translocation and assembly module TamB
MKWFLAALALLVAIIALGAYWLLETEAGLRWAAARAQAAAAGKLKLEGVRGALAHDVSISKLEFQDERTRVELSGITVRVELLAFLGQRAGIRTLRADLLEITLGAPDGKPLTPPALPFGLRIDSADIARIKIRRGDERYVLDEFQLRGGFLRESGAVAASASFLFRHDQYPATVRLHLGGTLERLELAFEGSVADVPGKAKAVITAFAARPLEAIDAEAGPADLAKLNEEWPHTALSVKVSARASAARALAGTLSARNAEPGPLDQKRVPIAALEARFATDFTALTLSDLKAALSPGGTIAGSGELRAGQAAFDVRVADLDLRAFQSTLRATKLHGSLKLLAGETQSLQGTLTQAGMSISADVLRAGDVLEVRSLRATAEGGSATGSGRVRLAEPMGFEARLRLAHFDPARFGQYPSGDISGAVNTAGTLGKNLRVDADWRIEQSTLEGEALESRGAARVARGRVSRMVAEASLGGARLTARGDFGGPGDELGWALQAPRIDDFIGGISGRLEANGTLTGSWDNPQASLSAQALGLRLPNGMALKSAGAKASGSVLNHIADFSLQGEGLELEARLRGGWRKETGWSGEIQGLRNSGRYPMQLKAPTPLKIASGRVELGRLEAALADGRLLVKDLSWSGKKLASSGEFSGLPAQWLVLAAGLTERVSATLLIDGQWNLSSTPRLTGTLSLRRASGDLTLAEGGPIELGLEKAVLDARFTDGRVNAAADIVSRYASAALKADVTPEPNAPGLGITPQSAIAFDARVTFVELRVLTQPLMTDARLDGRLAAEVQASGTLGRPKLAGTLRGEALAFDVPPYGVFLKNGTLRAVLEGDTLRVEEFSIQGGEGRLTASGMLPLRLAQGDARVTWRAEKFGLLERPDLRLVVSGSGEAKIADKRVALSGALRAERGYLELEQERLPKLGDDVIIVGQSRAPAKERARVPVALDVQLDLGDQLEVRGYGLEGKLAGQLQVETTKDGELRVYGRINAVNATFLAYGNRLQVDPGVAIFDGPLDNPALQMTAWRRNQLVEVGVQVTGNARSPRVQLVSQPPVSEGERLSWLVLGRPPADATKADLGLLQAAAGALLARGDQTPLDRRIARAFGLDEISLRGSGEAADRVVAVGKRLTDRLYISYEQGLGIVASSLVKLDLSLTRRLAVRAETGTSSGIGLFYRFSWD